MKTANHSAPVLLAVMALPFLVVPVAGKAQEKTIGNFVIGNHPAVTGPIVSAPPGEPPSFGASPLAPGGLPFAAGSEPGSPALLTLPGNGLGECQARGLDPLSVDYARCLTEYEER